MKIKKLIIGAFTFIVMAVVCVIAAGAETYGSYTYKVLDDGTVDIVGYSGSSTSVTIPSVIDGKSVSSVGYWAFANNTTLKSVTIPSTVKTIGECAFYYNSALETVNIKGNVTKIDNWAFYNCNVLKSINLPSSLVTINERAFGFCQSLTSVKIPDSVTTIGEEAFYYCPDVSSLTIGNKVQTIGARAFMLYGGIKEITIPASCKSIGTEAFASNFYLTTVNVLSSAVTIADTAFDSSNDNLSFRCYENSTAQTYAKNNSFGVILIGKEKPVISLTSATTSSIKLEWDSIYGATGYVVYKMGGDGSWDKLATVTAKEYTFSSLAADTKYQFAVRAQYTINGKTVYSPFATATDSFYASTKPKSDRIETYKNNVSAGYVADIGTSSFAAVDGTYIYTSGIFGRWAYPSEICQFIDKNGYMGIAYCDSSYVYIVKLDRNGKKTATVKIAKKYPVLGDVECDTSGNYYIVWAPEGESGGGSDTSYGFTKAAIAVSKYNSSGTHIKTTTWTREETNTAIPFDGGNCDTVITDGKLICNFAHEMCNGSSQGHQSNEIIGVYIDTMAKCTEYSTYNSHSFDQRIVADSYGEVWTVSHGDCYDRAFTVGNEHGSYNRFHFYCDASATTDMWVLNVTNAQLGDLAETSAGMMLVGASVKGMTESTYNSQMKNLFITSADNSYKISGATSRTGICKGKSVTDENILWLTNYTASFVNNPQAVGLDDGRIAILWEEIDDASYEWKESYVLVLNSDCTVAYPQTPIGKRLNSCETPIFADGYIYWATCEASDIEIVRLQVGSLAHPKAPQKPTADVVSSTATSAKLQWNSITGATGYVVYRMVDGIWERTAVTTNNYYNFNGLVSGTSYNFAVRAYKTVSGTNYYSAFTTKYDTVKGSTIPATVSFTLTPGIKSVDVKWSKVNGATGYIVYYKEASGDGWTRLTTTTGASYTKTGLTAGKTYYFTVKAYKTYNGKTYNGKYTTKTAVPVATLAKPTVTATAGDKQVTLKWNSVVGASYYQVIRYKNGVYSVVATVNAKALTIKGLTNNFEYTYLVKAVAADGSTALSAAVKTTPVSSLAKPVVTAVAGNKQATLSWNAVTGASYYQVIRYNKGEYQLVATIKTNSVTVMGLTNAYEYTYLVCAVAADGTKALSLAVNVTPKGLAKATLTAAVGDKQVTLKWTAVAGASYYRIVRYKNGEYSAVADIGGTSATVKGLTNNYEYTYLIMAVAADGSTSVSNAVNVTPRA